MCLFPPDVIYFFFLIYTEGNFFQGPVKTPAVLKSIFLESNGSWSRPVWRERTVLEGPWCLRQPKTDLVTSRMNVKIYFGVTLHKAIYVKNKAFKPKLPPFLFRHIPSLAQQTQCCFLHQSMPSQSSSGSQLPEMYFFLRTSSLIGRK